VVLTNGCDQSKTGDAKRAKMVRTSFRLSQAAIIHWKLSKDSMGNKQETRVAKRW